METLSALIEGLSKHGDEPALLIFKKKGVERWSFEGLAEGIRALSRGLVKAGVVPGEAVALLSGPRPEWVLACLAVIGAGGAVVPLDTQMTDGTLSQILADCGAGLVITEADRIEQVKRLESEKGFRLLLLESDSKDEKSWHQMRADEEGDLPSPSPDDRAALFYTSGTTGPPKGVPLSHANLAFQINTLIETGLITEEDRVLLPLPFHHVYPFVIGMLSPLAFGATVILPRSMTGPEIFRALSRGKATIMIGVPRLYGALYSAIHSRFQSRGRIAGALFDATVRLSGWVRRRSGIVLGRILLKPIHRQMGSKLKILASGGSALDPGLARNLEGIGWQVAVGYGLTETAPLLTLNLPGRERAGSVGQPIPGVEIRINPSEKLESSERPDGFSACGDNRKGEVLARGPNVFKGYHNLPEKTEGSFAQGGWFRTGDLGCLDHSGYLYLFGRASTLIVTEGGENVQPEEVEEAYEQSPWIREIGILSRKGGLAALIVPERSEIREKGPDGVREAIRKAVEKRSKSLPSYHRISDFAVTANPLPRTRLGKIQRHLLEERYEQAKEQPRKKDEGPISPEQMSNEDRLLLENRAAGKTWKWLARRYSEYRLTPDTSPELELGVDSMEWLNLTLEIGRQAGVELEEEAIGRIETVRDLLREVADSSESDEPMKHTDALFSDPESLLSEQQKRWLKPLEPPMVSIACRLHQFNRVMMHVAFHLETSGLEHLPEKERFVLAPNHTSYLDPFAVAASLDFSTLLRTCWGGWTGAAFRNPVTRFFSRLGQVVPIDPERAVLSSLAFGAAVLKRGKNLVWFPEGQRSPSGELQPFRPGIGLLLHHVPTTVVPVRILGSYQSMPPGKWLKQFHPIKVVFGKPLNPDDLEQQGKGENPQDRIADALHDRIAEMQKS